jgi:hypothetical protein
MLDPGVYRDLFLKLAGEVKGLREEASTMVRGFTWNLQNFEQRDLKTKFEILRRIRVLTGKPLPGDSSLSGDGPGYFKEAQLDREIGGALKDLTMLTQRHEHDMNSKSLERALPAIARGAQLVSDAAACGLLNHMPKLLVELRMMPPPPEVQYNEPWPVTSEDVLKFRDRVFMGVVLPVLQELNPEAFSRCTGSADSPCYQMERFEIACTLLAEVVVDVRDAHPKRTEAIPPDPSAYVSVKEILDQHAPPGGLTYRQLARILKDHPEIKTDRRKSQRPKVHLVDWIRFQERTWDAGKSAGT